MTEDGEILVYYLSEAFERFQPPEEWIEAVATTRGQKQRDDKGYKSSRKASFFFFFFALLSHCSMTLLNWSKASTVNYVTASKQTKNKSSLSGFLINPPPPSPQRTSLATCATPTNLTIRQRLFQSAPEAPLDISDTPTAVEVLAHKVFLTLEEEKAESRRYSL